MQSSSRPRSALRRRAAITAAAVALAVVPVAAFADSGTPPAYVATLGGPSHAEVYPSGVEVAPNGDIVVADTGNDQVARYSSAGAQIWRVGTSGNGTNQFNNPRDVGVDSAGEVFVADNGNARVVKLSASGAWLATWRGPAGDQTGAPIGITVTADKVYVADAPHRLVRVYDTALSRQLASIGSKGACTLAALRDADADAAGNVYVANYTSNNIVKFSAAGGCIASWGTKGTADGQFMNPYGVRVARDPKLGTQAVYVADSNNDRIQEFTPTGGFVAKAGTVGSHGTNGTFDTLRRVAVAANGDIWGADLWGWRLERFHRTATGYAYAQTIGSAVPQLLDDKVFHEVRGVGFSSNGDLFAADTVNQRIVHLTAAGHVLGACGMRTNTPSSFNWPRGVAVDQSTNEIWVADTKQSRLQVLSPACDVLKVIGAVGAGPTQFNYPYSVAIRQSDRIAWVADTQNNRVDAYDVASRSLVATFGTLGAGTGNFNGPGGIAVDPANGHVLVADTGNNRVVELSDSHGSAIKVVRSYSVSATPTLSKPLGVAADSTGRIYIADSGNNRLVVLRPGGGVLATVTGPSGFDHPENVAVDAADRVYVSDTYNDRIQVYSY